ncbi:hypothetical protein ASPZODRAFT_67184 [Penicilliopsis zonata CBS 506.65]|uniref:Uncharacterized protein n=1 Tax=Penicilliopsis zonata CBS 506.65 TaxID=1073090 RepID=A0A1L9SFF6_9EURO|nr:hypothetical protein ASPZODRAFT_67184 [Penicilliopsis zonata CBS 506.65]OJJ46005.1 hypothetical protein ASPZODRAFT_67184 [Penicilliopsis zonata CBS 506.65]
MTKDYEPQHDRFNLPGYGLPLDYSPVEMNIYGVRLRSLFPNCLDDRDLEKGYADQPLLTLREIDMMKVMEEITDEPDWLTGVDDEDTLQRWTRDALARPDVDISPAMARWIVDELRFKARLYPITNAVSLYNGCVVKTDTAVPDALRVQLSAQFYLLGQTPVGHGELVPSTGEIERDIIALTYYPLVYGQSRALKNTVIGLDDAIDAIGQGEVIPRPAETGIVKENMTWRVASDAGITVKPYSTMFQMLPTDDSGRRPGGRWRIASYINNLHPIRHRECYTLIEELLNLAIPMFNTAMTPLKDMLHSRARIEYHVAEYYPLAPEVAAQRPQILPGESDYEFEQRLQDWRAATHVAVQPDVDSFRPWAVPVSMLGHLPHDMPDPVRIQIDVDLDREYAARGLQIIVRMLEVNVKPENPVWEIDWHAEGQMNEHICATAFYIVDHDNLHDSYLAFRQRSDISTLREVTRDPNDTVWLKQVFGLEHGHPAVQRSGAVKVVPGRLIVFPNTMQHDTRPFRLVDPSREGHSRVMMIFLVDPNIRIISTANVPPQRMDWTKEAEVLARADASLDQFPLATQDRIMNRHDGFPFTKQDAEEYRARMWKERRDFSLYHHVAFSSSVVDL